MIETFIKTSTRHKIVLLERKSTSLQVYCTKPYSFRKRFEKRRRNYFKKFNSQFFMSSTLIRGKLEHRIIREKKPKGSKLKSPS